MTEYGEHHSTGEPYFGAPYQMPPQPLPGQPAPDLHPYPTVRERLKRFFAPLIAVGAAIAKFGIFLVKIPVLKVVLFMGVSVVAYALLWGWQFAVGFVLLIFVHEMGHVVVLRKRGIKAGLPVFLPFLGAFVSMKESPKSVYEEAESALAGPVVGTIGALIVFYFAHTTGSDMLRALAYTGLLLNLFNLLPMLPLDGGRVAGALHPAIWFLGLILLLGYEIYRPSPVIPIILILGGYELWQRWRNRNSEASKVYFALQPSQRMRIGFAYVALIAVIVVGMHASYVPRHLNGTLR
jgi:Zn-dependent protease